MRMNFFSLLFILIVGVAQICAEMTNTAFIPTSVKAMGLAGANVAVSSDFSALFDNPGGLGFMPVREFSIAVGGLAQSSQATLLGTTVKDNVQRVRFDHIGWIRSIPTSQGGFAFGFGYQAPFVFDDVVSFEATMGDTVLSREYASYGNLDYWTGGFGVQVARGLGIGMSASLVTGGMRNRMIFQKTIRGGNYGDPWDNNFDRTVSHSGIGYDVRAGLMYAPVEQLHIALRVALPQTIWFSGDIKEEYPKTTESMYVAEDNGTLISTYNGALGISYQASFFTASLEVHGRAPYSLAYPDERIPDASVAAHSIMGGAIGVELPVPRSAFVTRIGYGIDQQDPYLFARTYRNETTDWDEQGLLAAGYRHVFGVSLSYVVSSVCIEGGYNFQTWSLSTRGMLDEKHQSHRASFAFSFRY